MDSSYTHPCGQFLDLENFHKFHLCGQFFYLRKFFHPSGQFFYLRKFSQVPIPRDSSFTLTFRVKALNNNSSLWTVFYLCQKVHPPGQFFNLEKNHWRLVQADKDKSSSQRGWVSIDRGVIAALLSTTPRPVHKSSTDDLGPPLCQVGDQES